MIFKHFGKFLSFMNILHYHRLLQNVVFFVLSVKIYTTSYSINTESTVGNRYVWQIKLAQLAFGRTLNQRIYWLYSQSWKKYNFLDMKIICRCSVCSQILLVAKKIKQVMYNRISVNGDMIWWRLVRSTACKNHRSKYPHNKRQMSYCQWMVVRNSDDNHSVAQYRNGLLHFHLLI